MFLTALADVAKARGMTRLMMLVSVVKVYKTLSFGTTPRFETIQKIIKVLGVSLDIKPALLTIPVS